MMGMFYGAKAFNQAISSWDVKNVKDMGFMFARADVFNHILSSWNVSNVESIAGMSANAKAFNQKNSRSIWSKLFTRLLHSIKIYSLGMSLMWKTWIEWCIVPETSIDW
jgi:surface protein